MPSVTLTVRVSTDDIAGMREWLQEYAEMNPRRPKTVLWEYVTHQLLSNSEWDGVGIRIEREARQPRPDRLPTN